MNTLSYSWPFDLCMVDTTISSVAFSSKSVISDSMMKFSRSDTYFVLYSVSNALMHLSAVFRSLLFLNLEQICCLALSHSVSDITLVVWSLIILMNMCSSARSESENPSFDWMRRALWPYLLRRAAIISASSFLDVSTPIVPLGF